jgi:hypothetical protein
MFAYQLCVGLFDSGKMLETSGKLVESAVRFSRIAIGIMPFPISKALMIRTHSVLRLYVLGLNSR